VTDDYRVEVVTTEALAEDRRAAIVELCIAAHDEQEFRNLFLKYIPSGGRHVLLYAGDELVTHAVATQRGVQPEGFPVLRTAYVDAVSTRPDRQGRGAGTAVMRRLAAEIGDYEIGCLQTDKMGFYERLGWELWRGPLAGRGPDGLIPTPDQHGVMVLRLPRTPAVDLDAPLTVEVQPARIWE